VRRSPLFAPLALFLLVGLAALIGIAASKALPSSSQPKRAVAPGLQLDSLHEHGSGIRTNNGYPGSKAGSVKLAADVQPTAYGEAPVVRSHKGVLRVTFAPHEGSAIINGQRWGGTKTFTSSFPGPTLKVNPGDTIRIHIINKRDQVTNLHFPGFRTSPSGLGDNVLRSIAPAVTSKTVASKKSVEIVVHIPKGHEQGLYWYHPHLHGLVDGQVYPGLEGLIVIGDVLKQFPWLHHIKQRTMALQAPELGDDNKLVPVSQADIKKSTTLVNGHYKPTLSIRPGELQLWRVANITTEAWYRLFLGGLKFYVIGEDGNPVGHTWSTRRLLVPPAKRFEFLVRGPARGVYNFESLAFNQGHVQFGQFKILKLVSQGPGVKPLKIPHLVSKQQAGLIHDVQNDRVYKHRQMTFSIEDPFPKDANAFKINKKLYNVHIIDQKVNLGTTEEWLLRNTSPEDHPFHIHTNDFLVEKINGHKVSIHGFQDTVKILRQINGKPGTVLIRQRFRKFQGVAVFHCHILFHEDHLMMANILIGPRVRNPSLGK
jgi:suppressor of ftsI